MAEEFEESEVVFQEINGEGGGDDSQPSSAGKRRKLKAGKRSSAAPVSIPENLPRNSWVRYVDHPDLDGGDGEMVPPHVIVGRRVAGKMMAFSVCTGNGRTLKGRDLSQVRNSILRLTGFLET